MREPPKCHIISESLCKICRIMDEKGSCMLRVIERKLNNQIVYDLQLEQDNVTISKKTIKYQVADVSLVDNQYLFIYDSQMTPINDSFGFLNDFLCEKSVNTKYVYMNALKALYSFEAIIGVELSDFNPTDIRLLKDFLLGRCRQGETIVFENLTERSDKTVNQYLGVYRQFLDYTGRENKYLTAKGNAKVRYRSHVDGEFSVSQSYKSNVKTITKEEVPRYISIEDYTNIICLIRDKYSLREECIVRLMYETGMRIGEVLGLTNEDVIPQKLDDKYHNCVYIRNRVSDKRYQLAKTTIKPASIKEYHFKKYNTINAGYQMVFITDELYELLGKYIDHVHNEARKGYAKRYQNSTIADSVCGNPDNFYIFINTYGSRLSNITWNKTLRSIYEEVGIQVDEKIRDNNLSHRFRHGFAMFQIQERHMDAVQLAKMLRHKSVSSVMKYYRPTISDKIRIKEEYTKDLYSLIPELKENSYA